MNDRVLHVTAVDFTTSRLLLPQLEFLVAQGYEVRVATGRSTEESWDALKPFRPIDAGFPRTLSPLRMATASWRLLRFIRRWRPAIVHLHTPAASLPMRLVPRFLWPRECRVVYTVHGYLHPWPPVSRRDRVVQRIEAFESRRTDVSLFQSREDFDEATAHGYLSKLVYLGNGVQDDWFTIAPTTKQEGRLRLVFVGRVVREKGILDLVEAVAQVEGVELHIAGDALASDRDGVIDEVSDLISSRRLTGRVVRHGMLERPALLQLMARMDALCLPSYREGVPRSVIEGLASGRPVLATNIRGSRELVVHERNGYLAKPGDVESLAAGLRWLLEHSADDFDRMGQDARSSVDPVRRESQVLSRLLKAYGA